ncbi:MAG TPA: hypothetical protein VED41_08945 [Solirubrobacteraceae bacterium]|nr:hypothetical protein [Solirubrobacteraceae bacterium]
MSGTPPGGDGTGGQDAALIVRLEGFAREAAEQESTRLGVPVQELVGFAVLYYLADVDSGRVARRIAGGPYPASEEP